MQVGSMPMPVLSSSFVDVGQLKNDMELNTEEDNMSDTDLEEEAKRDSKNDDIQFEQKLDQLIGGLKEESNAMDTKTPGENKRSITTANEESKLEGKLNLGGRFSSFLKK